MKRTKAHAFFVYVYDELTHQQYFKSAPDTYRVYQNEEVTYSNVWFVVNNPHECIVFKPFD